MHTRDSKFFNKIADRIRRFLDKGLDTQKLFFDKQGLLLYLNTGKHFLTLDFPSKFRVLSVQEVINESFPPVCAPVEKNIVGYRADADVIKISAEVFSNYAVIEVLVEVFEEHKLKLSTDDMEDED